jgi:hypothetical protein
LPQVKQANPEKTGSIVAGGKRPKCQGQVELIKKMQAAGAPVVAIKGAHDWLIDNGVIPDYALAIDPQEHRIAFYKPHKAVQYMIASQCHPAMFDNLAAAMSPYLASIPYERPKPPQKLYADWRGHYLGLTRHVVVLCPWLAAL